MLVYNRPEKYFPERDEILERQGAARPHWYVMCIHLNLTSHFKIKVDRQLLLEHSPEEDCHRRSLNLFEKSDLHLPGIEGETNTGRNSN